MKKLNNKGFTLAELLIVVAIIAVLVAIAIPVFTTRLEQSRETTDIANLRSAYAAASVAALSGDSNGDKVSDTTYYYDPNDGVGVVLTSASSGATLGQGTATDGKAKTDTLPDACDYVNTTDVRQLPIKITFKSGMVETVKFEK